MTFPIENESHLPTRRLAPMVDFLVKRTAHSYMACLFVLDALKQEVGGRVDKYNPDRERWRTALPSVVRLWVPQPDPVSYPKPLPQHVAEVGRVVVHSWEEEVLFVLAHELAHLEDLWTNRWSDKQAHEAEVAAEKAAGDALDAWRVHRAHREGEKAA